MIKIPFYTTEEKSPSHGMEIIVLFGRSQFDMTGFEPRQVNAEYSWEEYDSEGSHTGNSACFSPDTEGHHQIGDISTSDEDLGTIYKLEWQADGVRSSDIAFWVSSDEYWAAFDNPIKE